MKRQAVLPKIIYASSVLAAACLLIAGFITLNLFAAQTTESDMKRIGGWAWNPIIGWVSQQSAIQDKDTKDKTGEFGVIEDTGTGDLSGWSWSAKSGWMCWGATCVGAPPVAAPGRPKGWAAKNADNTVEGWAQLLSYKENGWICLSEKTCGSGTSWGVRYDPVKNEFTGWGWAGGKLGWLVFSGKTLYDTRSKPPCPRGTQVCAGTDTNNIQYTTCKATCADTETVRACTIANSCISGLVCSAIENRCVTDASDTDKGAGYIYGRSCDPHCDKAVNTENDDKETKWKTQYLGTWLKALGGTVASLGGIVGSGALPMNEANAEFLVISGTSAADSKGQSITQFSSFCEKAAGKKVCSQFGLVSGTSRGKKEGALEAPFAKRVSVTIKRSSGDSKRLRLKSKGASIDIDAITDLPETGKQKNGYGKRTSTIALGTVLLNKFRESGADPSIYVVDGDLTLDGLEQAGSDRGTWKIWNGLDSAKSGARTVVVKGTLTIRQSLIYEPTGVGVGLKNHRQIASIAWIALKRPDPNDPTKMIGGDIVFDGCIPPSTSDQGFGKLLVEAPGIFFAEGQIKTGSGKGKDCKSNLTYTGPDGNKQPNVTSATNLWGRAEALLFADSKVNPDKAKQNAARIAALKGGFSDVPLVVHGAMIAKKFIFERVYVGSDEASEKIINDGRMFVNIPPGLEDFMGALPAF